MGADDTADGGGGGDLMVVVRALLLSISSTINGTEFTTCSSADKPLGAVEAGRDQAEGAEELGDVDVGSSMVVVELKWRVALVMIRMRRQEKTPWHLADTLYILIIFRAGR